MWFNKKDTMIELVNKKKAEILNKYAQIQKTKNFPESDRLEAQVDILEELLYGKV
jgi:hypothetical protein